MVGPLCHTRATLQLCLYFLSKQKLSKIKLSQLKTLNRHKQIYYLLTVGKILSINFVYAYRAEGPIYCSAKGPIKVFLEILNNAYQTDHLFWHGWKCCSFFLFALLRSEQLYCIWHGTKRNLTHSIYKTVYYFFID